MYLLASVVLVIVLGVRVWLVIVQWKMCISRVCTVVLGSMNCCYRCDVMGRDGRWLQTLSGVLVAADEMGLKTWEVCGLERHLHLAWDLYKVSYSGIKDAATWTSRYKHPRARHYGSLQVLQIGSKMFIL